MGLFDKLFGKKEEKKKEEKELLVMFHDEKEGVETRQIPSSLEKGISLANSGNWGAAKQIFEEEIKRVPDYDVPYEWMADYYRNIKGDIDAALAILKKGVGICIRKKWLLKEIGEILLFERKNPKEAINYFVRSIKMMRSKPIPTDFEGQRPYLFLSFIFKFYEMNEAAERLKSQTTTTFSPDYVATIQRILLDTRGSNVGISVDELSKIYEDLEQEVKNHD